jgi:RNA polymerase sigma factor (sigma-70 family)
LSGFGFLRVYSCKQKMTDSHTLLSQYARTGSESAFRELVSRYIDLVYSTAFRLVDGDVESAQDVAQTVFVALADQARTLPKDVMLGGWLHLRTRFAAGKLMRTERRRQLRERQAAEMNAIQDHSESNLAQVAPVLDEAIGELGAEDRTAILLRFFERKDFRGVGEALGSSEDAARKRVDRALEKLHVLLKHRGATLSAAALGTALATEAVTAAPAGLAGSVAGTALASAAAGGGMTATLVKLMATTKLKAGLISAIVVASVVAPLVVQHQAQARLHHQEEALRRQADQLAKLQGENTWLSNLLTRAESSPTVPKERSNEVLRLRGEVGRLQAAVQELRGRKTNEPLSREDVLASMRQMYLDRVNRLKQLFAANPAEAVPELQYLTDRDWLGVVEYDYHRLDPDNRHAMGMARTKGRIHFAKSMLISALHQYAKDNNGQFPTALPQLASYFNPPVDDSVLQDWTILPTTSLPSELRGDEDQVITQKAPINAELDQRIVVGLTTWHLGAGGTNDWGPVR